MTIEDKLLKYITDNPYNEYYKFVEGINVSLICVQLKINEEDFNNALNFLVSKNILKKELTINTHLKHLDKALNSTKTINAYK